MTVVLDTSAVVALMSEADANHPSARAFFETSDEELVTSPLVLAEMDQILMRVGGRTAADALRKSFERGAYTVRWWADALDETLRLAKRSPGLTLADASLVALAGRARTARILTFDDRFRSLTTPTGEPFDVLPERT